MSLKELQEAVLSGMFGDTNSSIPNLTKHCEFEHWENTPITDQEFISLLPDKIVDPKTGKEIYISQSKIKAIRKEALGLLCPKRLYHTRIVDDVEEEDSSKCLNMGKRFEYELTGAPDRNGEIPGEVLTKTGKIGEDQRRITENARRGKETLERLGIDLNKVDKQKGLYFKCLSGHLDLYEPGKIVDIKYTGLIGDKAKYHELGWDIEDLPNRFELIVQAIHYTLLARLTTGSDHKFMFLIFNYNKGHEGEYLPIQIDISEDKLNQHKHLILSTIEQLDRRLRDEDFDAVPAYKKGFCKDCPVKKCTKRKRFPDIEIVSL